MINYKIRVPGGVHKTLSRGELGISPGHPSEEGEKLHSLLGWMCGHFEECYITLSDSLYRFNFRMNGQNDVKAYLNSLAMGERWLFRNKKVLDEYKGRITAINRWNEWIYHPDFETTLHDITQYYAENTSFNTAVNNDIQEFIKRKLGQGAEMDIAAATRYSLKYMLEEAACYILIGRTYRAARVYPSTDMESFAHLRQDCIPDPIKGLELAPHVRVILNSKTGTVEEEENVRAA